MQSDSLAKTVLAQNDWETYSFTGFTFDWKDDREKIWKKTKNGFHNDEVKLKLHGARILLINK